jgi:hypothetical protein
VLKRLTTAPVLSRSVEFEALRRLAQDEGLPAIDGVLAATATSISVGKNPILLGSTMEDLRRLGRVLTGAIATSFYGATILQVQSAAGAEMSFRISQIAGDGWIVVSWFTDRPDLLLRFDLTEGVKRWRAVVLTTARFQALSRGLDSAERESFAFIDTQL